MSKFSLLTALMAMMIATNVSAADGSPLETMTPLNPTYADFVAALAQNEHLLNLVPEPKDETPTETLQKLINMIRVIRDQASGYRPYSDLILRLGLVNWERLQTRDEFRQHRNLLSDKFGDKMRAKLFPLPSKTRDPEYVLELNRIVDLLQQTLAIPEDQVILLVAIRLMNAERGCAGLLTTRRIWKKIELPDGSGILAQPTSDWFRPLFLAHLYRYQPRTFGNVPVDPNNHERALLNLLPTALGQELLTLLLDPSPVIDHIDKAVDRVRRTTSCRDCEIAYHLVRFLMRRLRFSLKPLSCLPPDHYEKEFEMIKERTLPAEVGQEEAKGKPSNFLITALDMQCYERFQSKMRFPVDVKCNIKTMVATGIQDMFIHANRIQIQDDEESGLDYIATQAPMKNTFGDFWQMILEKKSPLVVMLANQIDKVDQYWPELHQTQTYGSRFQVKCVEEQDPNSKSGNTEKTIVVRTFTVLDLKGKKPRPHTVKHIQYNAWPAMGVPDLNSFSELYEQIDLLRKVEQGPMVVHCSAGISRTGTLIAIDMGMQAHRSGTENQYPLKTVQEIVERIRWFRWYAVVNPEQYKFIHDFLTFKLIGPQVFWPPRLLSSQPSSSSR